MTFDYLIIHMTQMKALRPYFFALEFPGHVLVYLPEVSLAGDGRGTLACGGQHWQGLGL